MVALVYAKTTTTYTSKVMSVNYVACRTKWQMATGAYRLAEMLDADWSVDACSFVFTEQPNILQTTPLEIGSRLTKYRIT